MNIFSTIDNNKYDYLRGKVIGIEGNIGVGKTTICYKLKEHLEKHGYNVKVYEEFVDPFTLEEFIENIKTATPIFQLSMLSKRKEIHINAFKESRSKGTICIIDRTLVGDFIFAQVNKEHFSDRQWKRYLDALKIDLPKPDHIVLMDAPVKTCIKRIMKRDRVGEDGYNEAYIQTLHDEHQKIELEHVKIQAFDNITAEQVLKQIK